jgi:hypothetical protein
LVDQIAAGLRSVLERYRSQAAAVLTGLGPEPGFAGTVLDRRLLHARQPDDIAAGDAHAANRLKPWLVLIFVEATAAQIQPGTPLPRICVHDSDLRGSSAHR